MHRNSLKSNWWIVTDIDGTLMDHQYNLTPALETIKWLQELKIPIIPCTSKTASEVRCLREDIGLTDPFIVENGGAIYGNEYNSKKEWELVLGKSYQHLRLKLDLISKKLGYSLTALNDMSYEEINDLTGLRGNSIKLALQRQWSVPFLNPPESDYQLVREIASSFDTIIYKGNRMSHLLGKGSHKGNAVSYLKKFFNHLDVKVIALGDSQNDIPLLEVANIAIVVPGIEGPNKFLKPRIESGEFLLAPAPHSEGWALAVKDILSEKL